MKEIFVRPQLHISEAMMLLITQIQVALIMDDLEAAESSWKMMRQISSEDDPRVIPMRQKTDAHRVHKFGGRGLLQSVLGLN